ncbi:hypothetical protein Poli38472_013572 [Pythium oligandrum]|uniref:Tripeptidyl-peptidase 2 n=1 Tax=Pythium oligandrum TaxID=41045 RepID=A0A8K1FHK7_PYTOL|nr:hypothetical protein Poli38472_013572 [Pythium oligandrum]|eukprot:TMW61109.1 hypothetical protein Poli38472_013572 [Pythium oligandrum]
MKSFPTAALLPKEETLADKLLAQFPEYDGRNTVVAIFDTGVDPGAIGLQTTSDGKPKVVDIIDATGSGDVDTSLVLEAKDGKLTLANGKVVTLNPEWKPSADGKYHVGTLAAFDLFPRLLVDRLKKERKEKFDIKQREAVNEVQAQLVQWSKDNAATTNDAKALRAKKDLQARLVVLDELSKAYNDAGPIYDAVVFFDGANWRAALDTKENGDFTGVKALTNYKIEREYATFSVESQFNYALNIYDEGNTLSVVCDAGAHGTHVAGIVAAHHPDQPECNGVAPGAQILAVKIGDSRLGSMETTPALSRAIFAMIEAKCDIINMSYGEYASEHNTGRVVDLLKELVDEHKITFVCSAGNNGPALGTIGAPGGTSSHLLGVGAYVSPQMMEGEYIMRQNDLSGITYTWSSRGPTFDGDFGVNVCAPGAAITAVPNWTLNKKQLMNGTSMSSPNCAGNIALLVSGLKAQGIAYTPYSLRRALEITALPLKNVEVYAQGKGLIQVLPAFEYLVKNANTFDGSNKHPLYYDVSAACGNGHARGVFLRDASDFVHESTEVNVTVKPIFHKHAANEDKVHFEMHLRLVPTARWVDVGRSVALMHEGRGFKVLVNTKNLPAGEHFAEVVAYDANNEARGPVFSIPVNVIKPEAVAPVVVYKKSLLPGSIDRRFVTPPTNATWADVIISRAPVDGSALGEQEVDSNASGKLYMFHVMQFEPFVRQSQSSFQKAFFLRPGDEVCYNLDLVGGLTAEFCLAQFWSALGDSRVQVEIRFHGIVPDQRRIQFAGGEESHKVLLWSDIQKETIAPSVSFTKWSQRIRPTSAEIAPLSKSRGDSLPDNRQSYELVLTYPITLKEPGKVTPRLPLLFGRLYESPFESQLSMIFNDKKQYLGTSDAYGESISLPKGSFTVRTQVRHEDVSKLEKLKQMVLFLDHSIKEISASTFAHQDDVALGRKALTETALNVSKHLALFIGEPGADKFPAGHAPGDILSGTIHYGKKNGNVKGSGRRPGGFEISYVIPPAATPAKEPEPEAPKDERSEEEQANEAVRDLLLGRVTKLAGKPEFDAAYQRLVTQFPTHLPVVQANLHHFDNEKDRLTQLPKVIEAADTVLAKIKQDELALFFGTRAVPGDQPHAQKKLQKEKETEKEILIDALTRKTRALGDAGQWDEFLASYSALQKWADVETPKFLQVALLHDKHYENLGLTIQRLRKVADLDSAEKDKILAEDKLTKEIQTTFEKLQWAHWALYEQQWSRVRAPRSYRKF